MRSRFRDLTVALTEARERLGLAQAAVRNAADDAILAHARELADQFIEESELIDDALRTVAAAHRERQRLGAAIVRSGCLHAAKYSLGSTSPTRMACALAVCGHSADPLAQANRHSPARCLQTFDGLADAARSTLG